MSARDQIIQKTCELLELQGYYATGLNQIIKESGSPKGSLYYYFPGGKEELAVAAIKQVGEIVLKRIGENLATIDSPAEAIHSFLVNIAFNVEQSGFRAGGPITTIALETASTNEVLRETCQQIYEKWQEVFAAKLHDGGIDSQRAERVAVLIISAIEGSVILCRTSRSQAPLLQAAQELRDFILRISK